MSVSEYFQPYSLLSAVPLDCKPLRFQATFSRITSVCYVLENMVHHTKTDHLRVFFVCMFRISSGSF